MLETVPLQSKRVDLPSEITNFISDLNQRVDRFLVGKMFAQDGFVACDHAAVANALVEIHSRGLAAGNRFCEWGSGFGGVASIASMLGFESYGIEINHEVLDQSRQLAADHGLNVEFVQGSFIPIGADDLIDEAFMENDGDLTLECHSDDAYGDLQMDIADFDVVFIFPWPNESALVARLFDRFAASGALLLTYNDTSGLTIARKS